MDKTYKVLFVDDEINVLNSLKRGLFEEEYECLFASSGKEALQILENEDVAVIVSDMRMPEMNGLQLLKTVKWLFPDIVCIVLSGYTQLQQILATINQVDIFKFITKPWKLEDEFKVIINQALDYYKIIEENKSFKESLENKNRAYQNILNRIDTTIQSAKRSTALLGNIGNHIFEYNWKHFEEGTKEFGAILFLQSYIYDLFVQAVLNDAKIVKPVDVVEQISKEISKEVPCTFNHTDLNDIPIELHLEMAIAILKVIIFTFKENFIAYGANMVIGSNKKGQLTVSLMTRHHEPEMDSLMNTQSEVRETLKLEFISDVFKTVCSEINMIYGYTKKDNKLVFILTLHIK